MAAAAAPRATPPDAWDLRRAAQFLGMSPRTLERYVARRMIPCIVYPPARVDEAEAKGNPRGTKPMIAFDPTALSAWRDTHMIGRARVG